VIDTAPLNILFLDQSQDSGKFMVVIFINSKSYACFYACLLAVQAVTK